MAFLEAILSLVLAAVPCCVVGAIPAAFLLAAAAVVVFALRAKAGFGKAIESFAKEKGLECRRFSKIDDPRAEGEYRGRKVLVERITDYVESGDMDSTAPMKVPYTKAEAWHKGNVAEILIRRESIKTKLDKAFAKAKDLELGVNAEFDRRFMVSADDEAQAKRMFDEGIQSRMLAISRELREVSVNGGSAKCLMIGAISDTKKLAVLLDLAVDVAEKAEK